MQKELKRYKKQEGKEPAAWRRIKIEELQARLTGLAHEQGWLASDQTRSSDLCVSCVDDSPAESGGHQDVDVHHVPSCKTMCISYCGFCPCTLCQDNHEVTEAETELGDLQHDLEVQRETIMTMYRRKGLTDDQAQAKIQDKVDKAEAKLSQAQQALATKQTTKSSSLLGCCQTAVAMPCMVGM